MAKVKISLVNCHTTKEMWRGWASDLSDSEKGFEETNIIGKIPLVRVYHPELGMGDDTVEIDGTIGFCLRMFLETYNFQMEMYKVQGVIKRPLKIATA